MNHLELQVAGMSCAHCEQAINAALNRLAGVTKVKIDLAGQKVTVDYDLSQSTLKEITGAIEDQGYEVVQVLTQT